jgi:hypothetical protein
MHEFESAPVTCGVRGGGLGVETGKTIGDPLVERAP